MSEKLRWVHDCTHNMGRKLIDDYQTRSLGHWFDACPHCAKPNPYHSKPTPPASQESAGEADCEAMTEADALRMELEWRNEKDRRGSARYRAYMEWSKKQRATLTAELAEAREQRDSAIAKAERLLADWREQIQKTCDALKQRNDALDECERLREALDRIAAYPMTPQDEIGYAGCRKIAIEALKGRGEK